MGGVADPKKYAPALPCPHVLLCRKRSSCIKGCKHKYRRTPKLGSPEAPPPLDGAWWQTTSPCVLPRQIWSFCVKGVRINRREPPRLGSAGTQPPCGEGVVDPLEVRPFPSCHEFGRFRSTIRSDIKEIRVISVENRKFYHPVFFNTPAEGVPLGIC